MTDLSELEPGERELARSLRQQLQAGETVDFVTASRLRAARARALATAAPRARMRWFATGGITVAAMLVAVLTFSLRDGPRVGSDDLNGGQLETLEVMTDELDMEFYEDLDLYEWLARDPDGTA